MTVHQAFAAVIAISALSGSTAVPGASAAAEVPAPPPAVVEPVPVTAPAEAPVAVPPPVGDAGPVDPPAVPVDPPAAPPPPGDSGRPDLAPAPPEVRGVEPVTEVAAEAPAPGFSSPSLSPAPSPPPPAVAPPPAFRPPRAVPPPRAMHAQSPDADSPSVSDCTDRPDGNACEQLGAVCNLREGGAACGQLRSRCDSEVSAPGQTDIDQCRAYERAAFCLERPLSSSCDAVVREPCARDGGSTPDDSPLCRLQEAVRKARAAERNRQQHGEHGGETPPSPGPTGGGGGDGGTGGVVTDAGGPAPVAAGALLVQLHEQLAAESPPDPVTLALARVKLVRRGVQVALLCDAAGQAGRLELRERAGGALIGKARFQCDEAGTMTVVVAVKGAKRRDLADGTSLMAKIVQPTSAGEPSSSTERVSIDTGG